MPAGEVNTTTGGKERLPMPLLEAKSVKKLFGGVVALSSGNLTCEAGRITGLLGTNGSGKSTISKIITGVYAKDGGTILYDSCISSACPCTDTP